MQVETDLNSFLSRNNVMKESEVFHFDQEEHNQLMDTRPWKSDPDYFTDCKISINAAIKMLIHACLGKNNEVMGLMQGRCVNHTFIIFDVIALNAEASETNVTLNVAPQAMTEFIGHLECVSKVGREHPCVGWYHSHPSYGCWLSGTDVANQELQQQVYQTFLAVVVDPIRSMTNQKLDLGAFRVYPPNYKSNKQQREVVIPSQKIKEFGLHYNRYYSLKVQYFATELDFKILEDLWKRYWGVRLSQSPLVDNSQYLSNSLNDLREKCFLKLEQQYQITNQTANHECLREGQKYSTELACILMSQTIKQQLFK